MLNPTQWINRDVPHNLGQYGKLSGGSRSEKMQILLLTLGITFGTFANNSLAMVTGNLTNVPDGYEYPNSTSLRNAIQLFHEFGSAIVCGESDSALNLYIKQTVGNKPFKMLSISSTDIKDIGKATCAAIVKP